MWPDPALGPLCDADRRFPLPGNVGLMHDLSSEPKRFQPIQLEPEQELINTLPPQPDERHFGVLAHYFTKDSAAAASLSQVFISYISHTGFVYIERL